MFRNIVLAIKTVRAVRASRKAEVEPMNRYSAGVTLWKAFWQFVVAMTGVGAGVLAVKLPDTEDEFISTWPVVVVPVVLAVWRGLRNYMKQHDIEFSIDGIRDWVSNWPALHVILIASVLLTGCVSTGFKETVAADGVTTTEYKAMSAAWPFGKLDTTNHEFGYQWTKDGGDIKTGQNAEGVDNTGMTVIVPIFEKLLDKIPSPVTVSPVEEIVGE